MTPRGDGQRYALITVCIGTPEAFYGRTDIPTKSGTVDAKDIDLLISVGGREDCAAAAHGLISHRLHAAG